MRLEWRGDRLPARVHEAFRDSMQLLSRAMTERFTDPIYAWPVSPSPRDVVDTGQLRASQALDFPTPVLARFSWPTEYAIHVFVGATLKNGTVLPARNVPLDALTSFDLPRVMATLYGSGP